MQTQYNDAQIQDITERMKKGNELLESVGLRVAVQIVPYLQDTQYTNPDGTLKVETPIETSVPEVIPAPVESTDPEVNPNI